MYELQHRSSCVIWRNIRPLHGAGTEAMSQAASSAARHAGSLLQQATQAFGEIWAAENAQSLDQLNAGMGQAERPLDLSNELLWFAFFRLFTNGTVH